MSVSSAPPEGSRYAGPALFGAVDGLTVVLGVMLPLLDRPRDLLLAAAGASLAEAVGMSAGAWLSDSDAGWREAVTIGAATCVASLLPAVPFALLGGLAARWAAGAVLLALAGSVALARRRVQRRSWVRALGETFGVLAAVGVVVGICSVLLGGA